MHRCRVDFYLELTAQKAGHSGHGFTGPYIPGSGQSLTISFGPFNIASSGHGTGWGFVYFDYNPVPPDRSHRRAPHLLDGYQEPEPDRRPRSPLALQIAPARPRPARQPIRQPSTTLAQRLTHSVGLATFPQSRLNRAVNSGAASARSCKPHCLICGWRFANAAISARVLPWKPPI